MVQPLDPERFPDGVPVAEQAWKAVAENLAFFDPWR
jgi:hypothetical protein